MSSLVMLGMSPAVKANGGELFPSPSLSRVRRSYDSVRRHTTQLHRQSVCTCLRLPHQQKQYRDPPLRNLALRSFGSKAATPFGNATNKGSATPFGGSTKPRDPFSSGGAASSVTTPRAPEQGRPQRGDGADKVDLSSLPVTDCISDVPVFPVPGHMRRPSSNDLTAVEGAFVKHVGLEELFPGTGLADLFDEDGAFRTELRRAARDDMFVPNPKFSDAANEQIKDLKASLMVGWRHSPTQFESLTRLFEARGLAPLDGPAFMGRIGALVSGSSVSGSLIDIVGITNKRIRHSWHQDNGLEGQITVMLGFPPEDRYEGPGVFSHMVKCSHVPRQPGEEGEVIQYEALVKGADGEPQDIIPEAYTIRPKYRKGCEIVVYNDANHLHSAPDYAHRESLWRLM